MLAKGSFDLLMIYTRNVTVTYCNINGHLNLRQYERQLYSCFHLIFLFLMIYMLMSFTYFLTIRTMGVATSLSGVMLHLPALQMLEVTLFFSQRHQQQICFAHVVLELA